nr:hypothetical protein [uncultured Lichenicoccus sp.]
MRLLLTAVAATCAGLLPIATPVAKAGGMFSAPEYLSDAMKAPGPWRSVLSELFNDDHPAPVWFNQCATTVHDCGLETEVKMVVIDGKVFLRYDQSKNHEATEHMMTIVFTTDGETAWADYSSTDHVLHHSVLSLYGDEGDQDHMIDKVTNLVTADYD